MDRKLEKYWPNQRQLYIIQKLQMFSRYTVSQIQQVGVTIPDTGIAAMAMVPLDIHPQFRKAIRYLLLQFEASGGVYSMVSSPAMWNVEFMNMEIGYQFIQEIANMQKGNLPLRIFWSQTDFPSTVASLFVMCRLKTPDLSALNFTRPVSKQPKSFEQEFKEMCSLQQKSQATEMDRLQKEFAMGLHLK